MLPRDIFYDTIFSVKPSCLSLLRGNLPKLAIKQTFKKNSEWLLYAKYIYTHRLIYLRYQKKP